MRTKTVNVKRCWSRWQKTIALVGRQHRHHWNSAQVSPQIADVSSPQTAPRPKTFDKNADSKTVQYIERTWNHERAMKQETSAELFRSLECENCSTRLPVANARKTESETMWSLESTVKRNASPFVIDAKCIVNNCIRTCLVTTRDQFYVEFVKRIKHFTQKLIETGTSESHDESMGDGQQAWACGIFTNGCTQSHSNYSFQSRKNDLANRSTHKNGATFISGAKLIGSTSRCYCFTVGTEI